MFEQGFSFFLKQVLRDLVEDGDNLHEKVQVGVFNGSIVLENLVLKNSILSLIDVPVSLSYGYIGRLEINIPWSRLGSVPVTVIIDEVYILVEPKYEWNPGSADRREQSIKKAKLAAAEIFANKRIESSNNNKNFRDLTTNWLLNSFLGKIMDNIHITLRNVHIRYEDKLSCPSNFCVGISFQMLHIDSRDISDTNKSSYEEENITNQSSFISDNNARNYEKELNLNGSDSFHKFIVLEYFSVYWNPMVAKGLDPTCVAFIGCSPDEIQALMRRTIISKHDKSYQKPRHHFILQPVDIKSYLDMNVDVGTGKMKANCRVHISDISINLEDRQLREIISMSLNMSNFQKLERFSDLRPTTKVNKNNVRKWWNYAIQAVLIQIRLENKKKFTFKQFTQRIEDKFVYIELWKSKLVSSSSLVQQLNSTMFEKPELNRKSPLYVSLLAQARMIRKKQRDLERLKDIDTEKSKLQNELSNLLTPSQLDEDKISLLQALEYELSYEDLILFRSLAEHLLSLESRKESWFGSVFNWLGNKSSPVSEEDKKTLLDSLKFDPEKLYRGNKKEVDLDEVMIITTIYLQEGSITLGLSSPEDLNTFQLPIPFLQLKLSELRTKLIILGSDGSHIRADISLLDFAAYELFPAIVSSTTTSGGNKSAKLTTNEMKSHKFIGRRNFISNDKSHEELESNISTSHWEEKSTTTTIRNNMITGLHKSSFSTSHRTSLFSCFLEINPMANDVDINVKLEMEALEVWFSPTAKWIDSMTIFAAWPENLQYWSEMEMNAINQFVGLKSRVNAKLEYMMNNHSNMTIEAKIKAPVLLIHDKTSSNFVGKVNVLVVDLGQLGLFTRKLAKAQHLKTHYINQNNVGLLSDSIYEKPNPLNTNDGDLNIEEIDDEFLLEEEDNNNFSGPQRNNHRRSSIFYKYNEISQVTTAPTLSLQPSNAIQPSIEDLLYNTSEEELFDVFHCELTQIEVYLSEVFISSQEDIIKGTVNPQYDIEKTTIVPKFEIEIEIQVSALPWDTTLPPVKLFVDIPEVNVQLNEEKLMRLTDFASALVKESSAFIESNTNRFSKIQEALSTSNISTSTNTVPNNSLNNSFYRPRSNRKSSIGGSGSVSSRMSTGRNNKRRSLNSISSAISRVSDIISEKEKSIANSFNDSRSSKRFSMRSSTSRRRSDQGSELGKSTFDDEFQSINDEIEDDDDNEDDDSFFSVDDNQEEEKLRLKSALDELKFIISQRESMKTQLLTDIRLSESDPSKKSIHENLKQQLAECELGLHQLKVSYVELIMAGDEFSDEEDDDKNNDEANAFKEIIENFMTEKQEIVSKDNNEVYKRDLIHANVLKLSHQETGPDYLEKLSEKELIYFRSSISRVNIDIQIENSSQKYRKYTEINKKGSSVSPTSTYNESNFTTNSSLSTLISYRLSLGNIDLKLRHRVCDSRISFYLREINFYERSFSPLSKFRQSSYEIDSIPLITSDSSFLTLSNSTGANLNFLGASEFIRLKYAITYNNSKTKLMSHSLRLHLGYLGINFDQDRLNPLVDWSQEIVEKVVPKFSTPINKTPSPISVPLSSSDDIEIESSPLDIELTPESMSKTITDIFSTLPQAQILFNINCFSFCILKNSIPLSNLVASSFTITSNIHEHKAQLNLRLTDLSIYDLYRTNSSLGSKYINYSMNNQYLGAQNMVFGSHVKDDEIPFFRANLSFTPQSDELNKEPYFKFNCSFSKLITILDVNFYSQLVFDIMSGVLVESLLENIKSAPAVPSSNAIEKNDKIPSPLSIKLLHYLISNNHGQMNIKSNGFYLILPVKKDTEYMSDSSLLFQIESIHTDIKWGQFTSEDSIESLTMIDTISLGFLNNKIINDFNIKFLMNVLPPNLSNANSTPSISLEYNDVEDDIYDDDYPLPSFGKLHPNNIYFSCSVSPIVLNIYPILLQHFLNVNSYFNSFSSKFNDISILLKNESEINYLPTHVYPSKQIENKQQLEFSVHYSVVLYEVSLVIDSKNQFIENNELKKNTSFVNKIVTPPRLTSTSSNNLSANLQQNKIKFSLYGLSCDFVINSSPNSLSSALDKICFENKFHFAIKTLLLEEVGLRNQIILCSGHVPETFYSTKHFFLFDLVVKKDLKLICNVELNEINLLVLPSFLILFLNVANDFVKTLHSINNNSTFTSLALISSKYDDSSNSGGKSLGEAPVAHPSSVPMSSVNHIDLEGNFQENKENILPLTVLFFNFFQSISFSLDLSLKAKPISIWIPMHNITPSSTSPLLLEQCKGSICLTIDNINFNLSLIPPSNLFLLEKVNNEVTISDFIHFNLEIDSTGIFLAEEIPTFFVPSGAIQVNLPFNSPISPNSYSPLRSEKYQYFESKVEPKVWLLQTNLYNNSSIILEHKESNIVSNFYHTKKLFVNKKWRINETNNEIKFKFLINFTIKSLNIQLYLDYRPYLKMYEEVLKPIIIHAEIFSNNLSVLNSQNNKINPSYSHDNYNTNSTYSSSLNSTSSHINASSNFSFLKKILVISSIGEFFSNFINLTQFNINFSILSLQFILMNDLYLQPVSLLRVSLSSFLLEITKLVKQRMIKFITLDKSSVSFELSENKENDKEFNELTLINDEKENTKNLEDDIEKDLIIKVNGNINVEYQNQKLIAIEPLLEPLNFSLNIHTYSPYQSVLPLIFILNEEKKDIYSENECNLIKNYASSILNSYYFINSVSLMKDYVIPSPNLSIYLDKVDINITSPLLELVILTIKSFDSLSILPQNNIISGGNDSPLVTIRNNTGVNIKYFLSNSSNLSSHSSSVVSFASSSYKKTDQDKENSIFFLHSGEEEIIPSYLIDGNIMTNQSNKNIKKINIYIHYPNSDHHLNEYESYWPPITEFSLEGVGSRFYNLPLETFDEDGDKKPDKKSLKSNIKSLKDIKLLSSSSINKNSSLIPTLVLDLVSQNGGKVLTLRSTARIFNNTSLNFSVKLFNKNFVLWETILTSMKGIFIPVHLCNLHSGEFVITPRLPTSNSVSVNSSSLTTRSLASASFPFPELFLNSFDIKKTDDEDDKENNLIENVNEPLSRNNSHIKRKNYFTKEYQKTHTYSHWLTCRDFTPSNFSYFDNSSKLSKVFHSNNYCCNVQVESNGISSKTRSISSTTSLLRSIILAPPVTLINLLAGEISVSLLPYLDNIETNTMSLNQLDHSILKTIPVAKLKPGESQDYLNFHSSESIFLSLKVEQENNVWSNFLEIPGCIDSKSRINSSQTYTVDILYKNKSKLTIQVEVNDLSGTRVISLYVPYWIINNSFLPLQFQHDAKAGDPLNGIDGNAPDQIYEENSEDIINSSSTSSFFFSSPIVAPSNRFLPRGIGKSRGINGIIIGPEAPHKGFADILRINQQKNNQSNFLSSTPNSIISSSTSDIVNNITHYQIIQMNYTNNDKKYSKIRLKNKNTRWSNYFYLDQCNNSSISIESSRVLKNDKDITRSINSPFFYGGKSIISFGIFSESLPHPFQRTKSIILVDKYSIVNLIGQSIEVRQINQDNLFTIAPNEETPLWWRLGKQVLQIRLARYGWSWSGKFSIDKEEEIPIRLRNDYNNMIFFVLICVVKTGTKVSIILKGGDHFSPFRFENHTINTFKIHQSKQTQSSVLLPYHCCSYAWDEPLAPHFFDIFLLKNALQSQDEWIDIGTFSFEKLIQLDNKNNESISMKIVADGPTKVLKIFDTRLPLSYSSTLTTSLSKNLFFNTFQNVLFNLSFFIDSFGISLVDSNPQELLYIALKSISFQFELHKNGSSIELDVEYFQINNQLPSTPYPALILPLSTSKNEKYNEKFNDDKKNVEKFFSLKCNQSYEYKKIIFLSLLDIKISSFDVNLEGTIITKLINMASKLLTNYSDISFSLTFQNKFDQSMAKTSSNYYDLIDQLNYSTISLSSFYTKKVSKSQLQLIFSKMNKLYSRSSSNFSSATSSYHYYSFHSSDSICYLSNYYIMKNIKEKNLKKKMLLSNNTTKIYIESLSFSEIKFNLTFNPLIESNTSLFLMEDAWMITNFLSSILRAICSTFVKIENCPLSFNPYQAEHVFITSQHFIDSIVKNYTLQSIKQIHIVLFSSQLLGNPVQLFKKISQGLWDFIYFPIVGFSISPEAFLLGTLRGTNSLIRNITSSICASGSSFASSLQVGLFTLGVIDSYSNYEEIINKKLDNSNHILMKINKKNQIQIQNEKISIFNGFKKGILGIFYDPFHGFKEDGAKGLVYGLIKGALGLFARPTYGVLGFTASTLDSISHSLLPRYSNQQKLRLLRTRNPRQFLDPYIPLQIYSAEKNSGLQFLSIIENGAYINDQYICHEILSSINQPSFRLEEESNRPIYLLLTSKRFLLFQDFLQGPVILWKCKLSEIFSISIDFSESTVRKDYENKFGKELSSVSKELNSFLTMLQDRERERDIEDFSLKLKNNFQCKLIGEPVLELTYFDEKNNQSYSYQSSENTTKKTSKIQLRFLSHEQLLSLLYPFISLLPDFSNQVISYLQATGFSISNVLSQINSSHSIHSASAGSSSSLSTSSSAIFKVNPNDSNKSLPSSTSSTSHDYFHENLSRYPSSNDLTSTSTPINSLLATTKISFPNNLIINSSTSSTSSTSSDGQENNDNDLDTLGLDIN